MRAIYLNPEIGTILVTIGHEQPDKPLEITKYRTTCAGRSTLDLAIREDDTPMVRCALIDIGISTLQFQTSLQTA